MGRDGRTHKTLIDVKTNEYVVIMEGEIFTSTTPRLYPDSCTIEGLQKFYPYLDFDELKLVDVKLEIDDNLN